MPRPGAVYLQLVEALFAAGRHPDAVTLVERMRGVPGLERLASQHVRIQINEGHGGCYTMHTDSGTGPMGPGQTLCLTALIYLNEQWQEGDGGELRVFPFPHAAEVIDLRTESTSPLAAG